MIAVVRERGNWSLNVRVMHLHCHLVGYTGKQFDDVGIFTASSTFLYQINMSISAIPLLLTGEMVYDSPNMLRPPMD